MEFLKRTLAQIHAQLGRLTVSQKLVFALSVTLIAAAVWQLSQYASEREVVPLLNQDFAEADLNRIVNKLEGWGEQNYKIKGGKILVEKSRQRQLIASLAYAEALPRDTSVGWSSLLESSDIWTPETVRENRKLIILQMMLAKAIEDGWPEVEKAEVFINRGSQRVLSNVQPVASASVMIKLAPGSSASGRLAESIAALVSSANNQMKRESVKVIVDGKLVGVAPEGEQISGDYIAMKTQFEQYFREKISNALPVPALVQVDVTLETTSTVTQQTQFSPDGEGSWNAVVEETGQEENSENAQQQAEPGLMANAADKTAPAGGNSQKSATEHTTRSNKPFAGSMNTSKETPRGGIREITAAVMIPSSYFEAIAGQGKEKEKEKPNAEAIEAVKKTEIPKIRQVVMRIIGKVKAEDEAKVIVEDYWAAGIASATPDGQHSGEPAVQADAASIGGLAKRYGKHIAISALAMISLFMVMMMVRKAGQPVEMKKETETAMIGEKPVDALSFEDSNIASSQEDGLLAGLELGEDAMRSQQVLGQIRQMVGDDPESTAALISRWMQED